MHTTYCVSLSTSFEAFTELSAATVGSGLPHAFAEAEGAVPRRQALCRGEGYKSLEGILISGRTSHPDYVTSMHATPCVEL